MGGRQEQTSKDKIWLVIIWEKSIHPVHEVRRLLTPREREKYQSFEPLIIVERI